MFHSVIHRSYKRYACSVICFSSSRNHSTQQNNNQKHKHTYIHWLKCKIWLKFIHMGINRTERVCKCVCSTNHQLICRISGVFSLVISTLHESFVSTENAHLARHLIVVEHLISFWLGMVSFVWYSIKHFVYCVQNRNYSFRVIITELLFCLTHLLK